MGFLDRLSHGWNAFIGRDPTKNYIPYGVESYYRPDRIRLTHGNERSIVNATLNRIAVDCAAISIEHVRLDEDGRYKELIPSRLNECLCTSANVDQTGRAFLQDVVMSMLDEGVVAVVPVETTSNPLNSSYDISQLRVGKVVAWYPNDVKVRLYNERTGQKEEIVLPKAMVALPENPFYSIMNEPNSIYQRLVRKLNQLDAIDAQSASGKLDLIIQLPYVIKTEARRIQAENRRKEIEMQLSGSRYGIAYTDGTERITQLNRAVENNLFTQIEYYTNMLNSQLGMPPSVFDGTADEAVMLNYHNRTIEPIVATLVNEFRRKFLTKTARTQGQSIMYFNDPFKLATVSDIANNADKFIRNEILTKNEFRQIIGYKPSSDPTADKLQNPNMPVQDQEGAKKPTEAEDENLPAEE